MSEHNHANAVRVLGRRADGRSYVWREYGTIAHLTALYSPSTPGWTACGRLSRFPSTNTGCTVHSDCGGYLPKLDYKGE